MNFYKNYKDFILIFLLSLNVLNFVWWVEIESIIDNTIQYIQVVNHTLDWTDNTTSNVKVDWTNWNINMNWDLKVNDIIDLDNSTYFIKTDWNNRWKNLVVDQKIWINNPSPTNTLDIVWRMRVENNSSSDSFVVTKSDWTNQMRIWNDWILKLEDVSNPSWWDIHSFWWSDWLLNIEKIGNWWWTYIYIWDWTNDTFLTFSYDKSMTIYWDWWWSLWNITTNLVNTSCIWQCF